MYLPFPTPLRILQQMTIALNLHLQLLIYIMQSKFYRHNNFYIAKIHKKCQSINKTTASLSELLYWLKYERFDTENRHRFY